MALYRNPIARDGDFADPFVLRHDGRYYLYCTNPDVRCWSSSDLVHWQLEGPTIAEDEFPGLVPFAPEVVYADGAFYMYTSPSGHGHYVLRADRPTGPFRRISGNVGHAIDGNVLIDDDGRWYFYWAGDEGIWGCEMASPTEFGEPVFTGIHMNGWTEGPFVSKRDGVYFMTLTGNHYLSAGYRIDAASSDHPLTGYAPDPLNPILVDTSAHFRGLGHSSTVTGPDLVSSYLVYHNINPDRSRDLDLDRQVWNRRSIQVLGPSAAAPAPEPADVVCDWRDDDADAAWSVLGGRLSPGRDGGVLSGDDAMARWDASHLGLSFTAELNLTATSAGVYGVVVESGGDSVALLIDRAAHRIEARTGDVVPSAALPSSFVHDALHRWTLEVAHGELTVHLDGRRQFALPCRLGADAVLGVASQGGAVTIGHCAATAGTSDDAQRTATAVVPGRFWATLSPAAADRLVHDAAMPYASLLLAPEHEAVYRVLVQDPGDAVISLVGAFTAGDVVAVSVGAAAPPRLIHVDRDTGVVATTVTLDEGTDRIVVRVQAGRPTLTLVSVDRMPAAEPLVVAEASVSGYGKHIPDPAIFHDAVVTAEVELTSADDDGHGDLLLRATQLAEGGEGDDTRLGIDFFRGYSVQFHPDRVVLARHGYDQRVLAERAVGVGIHRSHTVQVRIVADSIRVDLDGDRLLEVEDDLPYLTGHVGLRAAGRGIHVRELTVAPVGVDDR